LVPGRMRNQCHHRWHNAFKPSIDQTSERSGKWTEEEINTLKYSVQMNGDNYRATIAAPLTGHTAESWCNNWLEISKHSVARVNGRSGTWTEDEKSKLKDAVQRYGDNDWDAIAALVPGRTKRQCHDRWHEYLNPSIDQMTGHTGKWAEDEDIKLKDAVQKHGENNWDEIATMVPGPTKKQCYSRWNNNVVDAHIEQTNIRSGAWTGDEDGKLQEAVQWHGGKDWVAIAALVPGRTRIQCTTRWHAFLKHSIDGATGRIGKWTEDEDIRLKYAVHTHGGKNWDDIATLVPGRTRKQCHSRWYNAFNPSIDQTSERSGRWTVDEDSKLKDVFQKHGDKCWVTIAALVPGRTKSQCWHRWKYHLDPYRSTVPEKEHGTLNKELDLWQYPHCR
jgi:hypothetical protein